MKNRLNKISERMLAAALSVMLLVSCLNLTAFAAYTSAKAEAEPSGSSAMTEEEIERQVSEISDKIDSFIQGLTDFVAEPELTDSESAFGSSGDTLSSNASESVSEIVPEYTSESTSEASSEIVSENTSEASSEIVSENMSEDAPESFSENTSEASSEIVSENMSEDAPESFSENTSKTASAQPALEPAGKAAEVHSGTFGKNLKWTIEKSVLTIEGTGAMPDYYQGGNRGTFITDAFIKQMADQSKSRPWEVYQKEVKKVVISEGITYSGSLVFFNMENLKTVVLPESLQKIGIGTFGFCAKLNKVTFKGKNVNSIGRFAFLGDTSLKSITIPEGVECIEEYAFALCTGLKKIVLPSTIRDGAVLPDEPYGVDRMAFACCSGMKTADLSKTGIETLPEGVFYANVKLTGVRFPKTLKTISDGAPQDDLETLGDFSKFYGAFVWCVSLKKIALPDSLNTIGKCAFHRCYALKKVDYRGTNLTFRGDPFHYCRSLCQLILLQNGKIYLVSNGTDVERKITVRVLLLGDLQNLIGMNWVYKGDENIVDGSYTDITVPGYSKSEVDYSGYLDVTIAGKKKGKTKLSAMVGRKTFASRQVIVTTAVKQLSLNAPDSGRVAVGKSIKITPVFNKGESDPSDKSLIWTSSDDSIATVSKKGAVKGKAVGTCVITAVSKSNESVKATCNVTVYQPVSKITLNDPKLTMKIGEKHTLVPTISSKDDLASKGVKWEVTKGVEMVKIASSSDDKAVIEALKKGTAEVTVTATDGSNKKAVCRITVNE